MNAINSLDVTENIKNEIKTNNVVLFMKGTPAFPMCGFSAAVVQILSNIGIEYNSINVLENNEMREGIKKFSNWPTIPQLYVKEEFIGGCDIIKEMFESGDLQKKFQEKKIKFEISKPERIEDAEAVLRGTLNSLPNAFGLPSNEFYRAAGKNTASGIVLGFLSVVAILNNDHVAAFLWLGLALLVDGIDGTLARKAKVNENVPNIDGSTLDNVIDFFTYVIIPALMIYWFGMVPSGWEIICSAAILAASCYTFANINQKTQDFYFSGFPALWNIVVLYFFILGTN